MASASLHHAHFDFLTDSHAQAMSLLLFVPA